MATLLRILLVLSVIAAGCSRSKHLQRADRATYGVLAEKTAGTPWAPPPGYSVMPDARSRFYDPTSPVDPRLPSPAPTLYNYDLPELTTLPPEDEGGAEGPSSASAGQTQPSDAQPLSPAAWEPLPESCLRRMLEFESVRREYEETFRGQRGADRATQGRRLPLASIVELALINSREYQTRKETLYATALDLTLERYAYELQFFRRGNGFLLDYSHLRNQGATVNTLAVPSDIGVQKITRRGADVLASFANDIVLTFNGPTGFSSSIGSRLLFEMSQTVLQRDIIFESLTQAERDVVYAARDFARFRKEFFFDFATDYYALLLAYRSIEIDSLDYFSNQREFRRGQAFLRERGEPSRIQVDQFEQNALRSRSNLVGSCNTLERLLDNLKLQIGVPPEMPLNIDLSELEDLTRRDALAATFQQASRNRRNLLQAQAAGDEQLSVQLNSAKLFAENLGEVLRLRRPAGDEGAGAEAATDDQAGPPRDATDSLRQVLDGLETADALLRVAAFETMLNQKVSSDDGEVMPLPPLQLLARRVDLARALLDARRAIRREAGEAADTPQLLQADVRIDQLIERRDNATRIDSDEGDDAVNRVDEVVAESERMLAGIRMLVGIEPMRYNPAAIQAKLAPLLRELLATGDRLDAGREQLPAVDIGVDDAMLTAVTQRLELANRREQLADVWRQIKLRGDALKAIVTWRFRQTIRTPSTQNRPFSFTFDESDTRFIFSFDAPLNRFAERNAFRLSLIDYNRALRDLIQLEDQIKLDVRNDLRDLQLDRNQYDIAVASAALAADRVYSTRLSIEQGRATARDFLEAQQAYTASLNAVAQEHIGYLINRMELFLDLEQLQVDELGYWQDLYNDDAQPTPRMDMPQYAASIYGDLPAVKFSKRMLRMLDVPAGQPRVRVLEPGEAPGESMETLEKPEPGEAMAPQREPPAEQGGPEGASKLPEPERPGLEPPPDGASPPGMAPQR